MQVVESFLSVQGEGKYSGKLAVFVRFAGCNFNCFGFGVKKEKNGEILTGCDTIKAVFVKEFQNDYENLSFQELFSRIMSLKNKHNTIVVITGGEPLIHHKNKDFIAFVKALLKENLELHFESNGSIEIDFQKYEFYKKCIFALSVKLENSGVSEDKRLNFKALKAIKENAKDSFYKFVLEKNNLQSSLLQIQNIIKEVPNEIYCMPMGENEFKLRQNAKAVALFCIKNGFNYSDRLHIRIWDDKEGV